MLRAVWCKGLRALTRCKSMIGAQTPDGLWVVKVDGHTWAFRELVYHECSCGDEIGDRPIAIGPGKKAA